MSNIYEKICPICGKEKKKTFVPLLNRDTYQQCQCEIDIETEKRKRDIKDGRNRLFFDLLTKGGIVGNLQERTFSKFETVNEKETSAKNTCISFADNPAGNLIIIGGTGTGKTHLSASIMHQYLYHKVSEMSDNKILDYIRSGNTPINCPMLFIQEYKLDDVFKSIGSISPTEESRRVISASEKRKILCIDDIGTKDSYTDNDRKRLFSIIDTRYIHNLPTIITSNCLPDELKGKIGDKIYDRLINNASLIILDGKSHRSPSEVRENEKNI